MMLMMVVMTDDDNYTGQSCVQMELCTDYMSWTWVGRVHPGVGFGRVGSGWGEFGHKISRLGWVGLCRVQCQKCLIHVQT